MVCYKNGIRVEEHEDVMPDIIKPGGTKNFKIKYHLPKGTDSLALSVMSADTLSNNLQHQKNEKLSPLNNPLSLSFICGITSNAIKLKVINGADNVEPSAFAILSISV